MEDLKNMLTLLSSTDYAINSLCTRYCHFDLRLAGVFSIKILKYQFMYTLICKLFLFLVFGNLYITCRKHGYINSQLTIFNLTLQWCHNGCNGIWNHQPHHCLLNRLFRRRSKKTSKLRITGLCAGNSPMAGEFPAQVASNVENVSIWWHHHD